MATLEDALKAEARRLGLDAVGIANAVPFDRERAYLEALHAAGPGPHPFEHPVLADRVEPERLLAGVRSIVAVAISYRTGDSPPKDIPPAGPSGGPRGWLSRYCRGLDYHDVLGGKLEALARWIEQQVPGSRSAVHVDMGPPLDRAMAERAGIGRFGKSTNLITPRLGTWTFLGELLTTAALRPDAPAAFSPCGSCTLCIDACPTQCLSEWQIDAHRCLGYMNQMDGPIPLDYREVMGTRLFGCDDCQDVCPYNRVALQDLHPEFATRPAFEGGVDLGALVAMEAAEFEQIFAPTAAAWRGLEPLQRNGLVALGNAGDPAGLAPLVAALDRPEPLLRSHAAWGVARLATLASGLAREAHGALENALSREADPSVIAELNNALAACPWPPTVPAAPTTFPSG